MSFWQVFQVLLLKHPAPEADPSSLLALMPIYWAAVVHQQAALVGKAWRHFLWLCTFAAGLFMSTGSSRLAMTWGQAASLEQAVAMSLGWAMGSRSPGELSSRYGEQTD